MTDFLVFEAGEAYEVNEPRGVDHYGGQVYDRTTRVEVPTKGPIPYRCIGAVRAKDEQEACTAIMAHTRRIGKFAVIEAQFLDFGAAIGNEPEGERPVLNP